MEIRKINILRWDISSQAHSSPDFGVKPACRTCFAEDTVDGTSVCMARCAGEVFDDLKRLSTPQQKKSFLAEKIQSGQLPIAVNPGFGATHKVDCSLHLIGAEVTIGR